MKKKDYTLYTVCCIVTVALAIFLAGYILGGYTVINNDEETSTEVENNDTLEESDNMIDSSDNDEETSAEVENDDTMEEPDNMMDSFDIDEE